MLASFSISPLDKGGKLAGYVARIAAIIDESGLDYRMGPMETTVEGDLGEVMDLIMKCHMEMRAVSSRVLTNIRIDDREGASGRLEGKVADVEKALGRPVRK